MRRKSRKHREKIARWTLKMNWYNTTMTISRSSRMSWTFRVFLQLLKILIILRPIRTQNQNILRFKRHNFLQVEDNLDVCRWELVKRLLRQRFFITDKFRMKFHPITFFQKWNYAPHQGLKKMIEILSPVPTFQNTYQSNKEKKTEYQFCHQLIKNQSFNLQKKHKIPQISNA